MPNATKAATIVKTLFANAKAQVKTQFNARTSSSRGSKNRVKWIQPL